jgi:pyroglutamyl-peptidase
LSTSILVTGFEPFGGLAENPSADVARALDGDRIAGHAVVGRVLPVVLAGQRARIETLLDEVRPALVVALGLAADATTLQLERQAVNYVHFAIADNGGAMPRDGTLCPDGPPALSSTLSLAPIAASLAEARLAATLSDSAGSYLCNATFYFFLDLIRRRGLAVPCGFIHLPPLGLPPGGFTLAQLIHAVRLAIDAPGFPGESAGDQHR